MCKRILVVAHDRTLGLSRVALLQSAGYTVDFVFSDEAALALLAVEAFDLVLLGRNSKPEQPSLDQRLRERFPDMLLLKIEATGSVPSSYPTRVTDARPANVLAALQQMLGDAALGSNAARHRFKPVCPPKLALG
jgi:CheY-like chemotaxis protein